MTSPQDPPPPWTAPGGSGDRPATPPTPPSGETPPPAPPTSWQPQGAPPAGPPQDQPGWAVPPVTPTPPPPGWGAPPAPPPTGWGAPQVPPAWTGQPPAPPGWGTPPPAPGYPPAYGYPAAPPAWRPPALQPGIIPLRPLSLGEILDGGVRAIRANPAVMFGLSAVVVTIAVALSALLGAYFSNVLNGTFSDIATQLSPNLDPSATDQLQDQLSYVLGSAVSRPITVLATTILTGLLVVSVSRSVLGRTIAVRDALRSGRAWWVVGFSLLSGVAVLVVAALLGGAIVLLAREHQEGAAVGFGILVALLFVVGALWFNTRTLLVTPALMLEGKGFWSTVGRAWRLTRGSFWRLFGIWLLVSVLMGVLQEIVVVPFSIGASVVGHGDVTSFASVVITSIGEIIALTAATTYTSAVVALLYIDVRMRREGLDIELGRAATADATAAAR